MTPAQSFRTTLTTSLAALAKATPRYQAGQIIPLAVVETWSDDTLAHVLEQLGEDGLGLDRMHDGSFRVANLCTHPGNGTLCHGIEPCFHATHVNVRFQDDRVLQWQAILYPSGGLSLFEDEAGERWSAEDTAARFGMTVRELEEHVRAERDGEG